MIRHVRVRNFKSLKDVSLELGMRNVAVGPNMSGKTNFISIFKFLNSMVLPLPGVYGLPHAVNTMGGFQEIAWRGERTDLISISLEGDFGVVPHQEEHKTWKYGLDFVSDGRGRVTVQEESLVFGGLTGEIPIVQKEKETGRRLLMGRQGKIAEVPDVERSALEFEVPQWEGNWVRSLFASLRFYTLLPAQMKQVNTTAAANFLFEHGANFSAWLLMLQTRYKEHFDKINLALRGALPDVSSVFTFPTQQATVFVASQEKFLKTPIPIWQMSDGELCFIAWLSLLFCPPELSAPVFFIEEPENHLHPYLIETLFDLLRQVQSSPEMRPAQIFATTHSLTVVDKSNLDEIIVFERQNGATMCTRPKEKAHLQELLSRREVGLGDLYYSGALGSE